jgi:hypothetical protein
MVATRKPRVCIGIIQIDVLHLLASWTRVVKVGIKATASVEAISFGAFWLLCCFYGAEQGCKGKTFRVTDAPFYSASFAEMNLYGLSVFRVRKIDWSYLCIA